MCTACCRFKNGTLKTCDDGGDFAPESVAAYEQQLATLDAHVAQVQQVAQQSVAHVRSDKQAACEAALHSVVAQLPPHKEDLAVIEALRKCMSDARRCVHMFSARAHSIDGVPGYIYLDNCDFVSCLVATCAYMVHRYIVTEHVTPDMSGLQADAGCRRAS